MAVVTTPVALAYAAAEPELCPRESLEWYLTHHTRDFARERDTWRGIVAAAEAAGEPRVAGEFGMNGYAWVMYRQAELNMNLPPEGISWPRWTGWVDQRLSELAEDPSRVAPLPRRPTRWQVREGVLDPQAQDAVRAALAATPLPVGTARRDHLVVRAARTVGVATHRDPVTDEVVEVPTRRVGVVLERSGPAGIRVLGLYAADAVAAPRGPGWRTRWPVLASALGGWFSQAALAGETPWARQLQMLEEESDEFLAVLAAQAGELLELGDEDLRAAVAALGSHVEPDPLRPWLEWMVWRIGYFDWK